MEYHLEREVRLSNESEYENLYKWSLQEYDENGKQVGGNQVPWNCTLNFSASELMHNRHIECESSFDSEAVKKEVKEREEITGILHSGYCRDGKLLQGEVSYSLFGTSRRVKQFNLRICKLDDKAGRKKDEKECCQLTGFASYTAEIDFRDETTEDFVEIYLWLSPERFSNLSELIRLKMVDTFWLSLRWVAGFYSEWSPAVSTNDIKILPRGSESKVVIPEKCKIEPPRLGEVGKFSLSIMQRNPINPKQNLQGLDINKIFDDNEDFLEDNEINDDGNIEKTYTNHKMLTQLTKNEMALSKLKVVLWVIVILLAINLFK